MASNSISTAKDDEMSKPTYRHAPPSNRIVDRRQYKKMYPATTAPKHLEEDKDLDDIDVIYEDTELHLLCQNKKLTCNMLEDYFERKPKNHASAVDVNHSRTPLHYLCMHPKLNEKMLKVYFDKTGGYGQRAAEQLDEYGERNALDYLLENKGGIRLDVWEKCIKTFQSSATIATQPLLDLYVVDTSQRKHQVTIHNNKVQGTVFSDPSKNWSPCVRTYGGRIGDVPIRILNDAREKVIDLSKHHDSRGTSMILTFC
eukprot:g1713.t1